jgi:hypothetical protein
VSTGSILEYTVAGRDSMNSPQSSKDVYPITTNFGKRSVYFDFTVLGNSGEIKDDCTNEFTVVNLDTGKTVDSKSLSCVVFTSVYQPAGRYEVRAKAYVVDVGEATTTWAFTIRAK